MAEMTAAEAIAWLTEDKAFGQECYSRKQIAALIEQQQQQIEQLKCCGNCINWRNGNIMQCMLTYKVIGHKGKCDQWQVKEGQ